MHALTRFLLQMLAAARGIKHSAAGYIARARDLAAVGIARTVTLVENLAAPHAFYTVECVGADGRVRWRDTIRNLVTTAGKNDDLTQYFKGSAYTAAWYVGLIDAAGYTTGPAVGDTMGSHGGWAEFQAGYSQGNRPALTLGTPSGGSVDNSASKAQYSITATATIKGAFVVNNNTKNGTTGTLYSAGTFTGGDRAVQNGDTLNVQATLSFT